MQHIVIIGNGIAGITAARNIRKRSDHRITVVSAESDHFFSRTALMYIYMGHMKYEHTKPYEDWFWPKNRIDLVRGFVQRVDVIGRKIALEDGREFSYDALLLATGSRSRMPQWVDAGLSGIQGLYSLQDLEKMEAATKGVRRAVIAGGGLIGIEMAEMLMSRNIAVTFLVREEGYWNNVLPRQESEMIGRHIREHGVDLRLGSEAAGCIGDDTGKVRAVRTRDGEEIPCDFVGVTTGVEPNIGFLAGSGIPADKGILVNEFLETGAENVYAAGDCAQHRTPPPGRRSVEQTWYTGRVMGETVARTMCGEPTPYRPGHWYNSAKFFDIEYQVYGDVPAQTEASGKTFHWERADGRACLRLAFGSNGKSLTGIHALGMRLRQEVCEEWLDAGAGPETVLAGLGRADFNTEFARDHTEEIVAAYRRSEGADTGREIAGSAQSKQKSIG